MKTQRNKEIIELRSKGLTLEEIGHKYNISRQRVEQIIHEDKYKKNRHEKYIKSKLKEMITK